MGTNLEMIYHFLVNKLIFYELFRLYITPDRRQSKTFLTIDDDRNSIETVFLIAICRQSGDKWQSKTLFPIIFDLRSAIILTFSIAAYPL